MKSSSKQIVISVMCLILLFIPTYIAISYYYTANRNVNLKYEMTVSDETGAHIAIDKKENDKIAEIILKMNSKMTASDLPPALLPSKYYSISIRENGNVISSYYYYMVAEKGADSYVRSHDGRYYVLRYSDAKKFLENHVAHHFYTNASLPTLSISGGDEILPLSGKWQYRSVNGSMLTRTDIAFADSPPKSPLSATSSLSFSVEPEHCTVRVYKDGEIFGKYTALNDIPYSIIDGNNISFKIEAQWDHSSYKGSASFEFSSVGGISPVYKLSDTSILSGEFFIITAENVNSPGKIEFSSIPEIDVDAVFFKDGDRAIALVPINKELAAPCEYTFTLKYGNDIQTLVVHVGERDIYEKNYQIDLDRSQQNTDQSAALLSFISSTSERTKYFGGKFIDYAPSSSSGEAKLADVFFGFGHKIIPSDGSSPYRLDGVVYMFTEGTEIPVICSGMVVHTGTDPLLGNFAVVDHGFGLKTWYCNLSSVSANVGEVIEKGHSVGVSGATGYRNINGVYLITTE